jgi:hypothetical protein
VTLHQERQGLHRDAGCGDQRRGAHGPGVQEAGAQCEGPVERACMQQTVLRRQPVPPLHHHAPRPDRAMGMGHGLGLPRRAGGEDEVGQTVGIAHGHLTRGVLHHRAQIGKDGKGRRIGQRDIRRGEDGGRRDEVGEARDLRDCQPRCGRHRHQTGGHSAEEGHRKIHRIAQAQEHPVSRDQAFGPECARHAEDSTGEARVAPAFGARGSKDRQRDLLRVPVRRRQDVIGEVEGRGAGQGHPRWPMPRHHGAQGAGGAALRATRKPG